MGDSLKFWEEEKMPKVNVILRWMFGGQMGVVAVEYDGVRVTADIVGGAAVLRIVRISDSQPVFPFPSQTKIKGK